jgi:O-antigen/teichoic acid export membrane protein
LNRSIPAAAASALLTLLRSGLLRQAGIYTASRGINAAVPLLVLPILTRYLDPTDYGVATMFAILAAILTPLVGVNTPGAMGVAYFKRDREELSVYIGNCFLVFLASLAAVAALLFAFAGPVSRWTEFPAAFLWVVVLFAAGQFVVRVVLTLWQVQQRAARYAVFLNSQTVLNVGLTVLLVVCAGWKWEGRVGAQLLTMLVFAGVGYVLLRRRGWIRFRFRASDVREALRFGVPLIPHELGALVITQTDRLFITNMISLAQAGIYTVGLQIAAVVELLASSFNQAYSPWLFRKLQEGREEDKRRIVRWTYAYFAGILTLPFLLSAAASWFLPLLVGRDFVGAGVFIFWIALGFAFSGMYYMVANYIFFAERTSALAAVTAATAVLNVVLNWVLISRNGAVGAAQASAASFFTSFVLTWIVSARVYPMPWGEWRNLLGGGTGETE